MNKFEGSFRVCALAGALVLGTTGCIKQVLLDGQIEGTRTGSAAVDTVGDYEVARTAAFAGLAQFEGMHHLAPQNKDALFLLTKGWTGATYGFIEDEMEQAENDEGADGPMFLYQQSRTIAGYERAIYYGTLLAEMTSPGFDAAQKNEGAVKEWLKPFGPADAENLFWLGYAWMARANAGKDNPAFVGSLFVGVAIIEKVVELDDGLLYGNPHTVLGSYHARTATSEMDEAKKHFDHAIEITQGKVLLPKALLASKYYCMKGDKEGYVKTLTEVLEAGDTQPLQRLQNTIAKRRAKRYMSKSWMKNCGF